ncbi:MAG: hypothetical protein ACXQS8_05090 [Candidatus Helarchaeales archaeon]
MKATCPDCYYEFELSDDVMKGEVITCEDCGAQLEVIELEPEVKLRLAEIEEEDWGE